MNIVQSRQPRFLERQVSIPEFVHHSPARSAIDAIEAYRQFTVQVSQEVPVRRHAVFEANDEMIMIGKESPRLQNEPVSFRQLERRIKQEVQFSI